MKPTIEAAIEEYGSTTISECIRLLEQRREEDEEHQSGMDLFQSILRNLRRDRRKKPLRQSNESGEIFHCHRVTVTPTSLILTGPLPDVTNRVLRKYMKHQSNFMRVEFRDENRLQIRLDREVDSSKFMNDRVGTILQHGLTIAGREFEFLAYSFSALKEHAVWFINPFDGEEGRVDAEFIRSELGDFSRVIRCPARYGARIAQAFSTTEPSITVVAEELIPIPDKKSNSDPPYLFTDGVGTISQEIAEEIWEGFTETRSNRSRRRVQTPSAYQIRLGGLKGMLCVDERLSGRIVCTRPSMDKFTAPDLTVEIARAFDRPMYMYLNRPLIMLLETLGLSKEPFMELQMDAVKQTVAASKSMDSASRLLEQHGLGTAFHMTSVLLNLHKINVDPESTQHDGQLISFIRRSLKFAVNHVLRDLKYKARIPVPDAWTLVGVADEYGYLKEGEIYAYVCTIDGKKQYIEGPVMISRSPTVHPGDARMVRAIGKPPENAPAGLARLTNCVVFSCKGERSLPSMLGGGDLDGDMYCLVMDQRLHPPKAHVPASYTQAKLQLLDRDATASDIAQFVVDYIKNDLLGVIANQILLTADLSPAVMADPDCLILAAKHSDAVDYPKTGQPVNFSDLPKLKSKRKPDWYANETNERKTGFYQSSRIIGHLFRAIHLPAIPEAQRVARRRNRQLEDNYENSELRAVTSIYLRSDSLIGQLLKRKLDEYVDLEYHACGDIKGEIEEMLDIFEGYGDQLAYTCRNHSLAKWTPLTEEEVVAGTIVAKCSQPRMRADMITAMRRDSTSLVTATREAIEGDENNSLEDIILRGWTAWKVSVASGETFGARSFGLLALDIIFSSIRRIDTDALY
ncbi:hypothetical protein M408DRAFT_333825 [Serendipita vermifera MAFF 305830]|uniref:RNA-dependent RNA polymerase n=1 Tax=Serendipita vermifera MAFF 305830 TaxID=933852 RepID=A0A0C3A801_SERVB|nr:hypothetical protein M408DRAFT_333825 [Serendipita vermifera MAFF 305830]